MCVEYRYERTLETIRLSKRRKYKMVKSYHGGKSAFQYRVDHGKKFFLNKRLITGKMH